MNLSNQAKEKQSLTYWDNGRKLNGWFWKVWRTQLLSSVADCKDAQCCSWTFPCWDVSYCCLSISCTVVNHSLGIKKPLSPRLWEGASSSQLFILLSTAIEHTCSHFKKLIIFHSHYFFLFFWWGGSVYFGPHPKCSWLLLTVLGEPYEVPEIKHLPPPPPPVGNM